MQELVTSSDGATDCNQLNAALLPRVKGETTWLRNMTAQHGTLHVRGPAKSVEKKMDINITTSNFYVIIP